MSSPSSCFIRILSEDSRTMVAWVWFYCHREEEQAVARFASSSIVVVSYYVTISSG
jgi:hypothetical protein